MAKIDYDGTISANEDLRDNNTTYRMRLHADQCAYVPAITEVALERLLLTALKGMRFGGGCGLTYNVYREGDYLYCSLNVRDMEFNSELYEVDEEEEEEEEEDFYEDLYSPKCNHSCVPGVGFWARLKWLFSK